MATVTTLLTAEEFARSDYGPWAELVRGEVEPITRPEARHGVICANVVIALGLWARARAEGFVVSNDAGVITERDPDTVRGPDVMLIPADRCPGGRVPKGIDLLPSLVIEVMSPSDRWSRMLRKVGEYLERGVSEVWVIEYEKRMLHRYRLEEAPVRLEERETLRSESTLPGFECVVSELLHGL